MPSFTDVTTMPSMPSLIHALKAQHPTLTFSEAEQFSWSPSKQTIFYNVALPAASSLLLHEVAHALLGHRKYSRDAELVAMEAAAWEEAKVFAAEYAVEIPETVIEDHLDTYREWLHARSVCPECSANGYQTEVLRYQCPACSHRWRVNEARICALRRYSDT